MSNYKGFKRKQEQNIVPENKKPNLNQDECESIEDKLKKLKSVLEKSFKPEFIDSIQYLIKTESLDQTNFDVTINECKLDWSKLDYLIQQLKKITKNKSHLLMLTNKLLIQNNRSLTSKQTSSSKLKAPEDDLNDLKDYLNLVTDSSQDYFCLTLIIVRFIFKLFKYKLNLNDFSIQTNESQTTKSYALILVLLSCLADLCYYEEIRIQVINDHNLKCLLEIFSLVTLLELEFNQKAGKDAKLVQLIEKFWSKMCRLVANLSQEKSAQKIKTLFTKEFMQSLCKCLEQQQLVLATPDSNSELDIDLYHSLLRFIKYSCELVNCKKLILENRLLVYICKYMYKLNKNVQVLKKESQTETNSSDNPIKINEKYHQLFKDLIKQYLIMLDSWQSCSEFYNQIIEGNSIEHLLWLQLNESNNLDDKSKICDSSSSFNYSEFSFNLMYKLCRDYHACRAEFGRVGGLIKYLEKIDQMTPNLTPTINKQVLNCTYLKEYTKLIDILCLSCKESANRLRLKEQNFLTSLIKTQQKLKLNKHEINKYFKFDNNQEEDSNFIDSTLYNKLLVALCCFSHDQDSMNTLLNNGLVDSLLAYLDESVQVKDEGKLDAESFQLESLFEIENKIFSLKKLLSNEELNLKLSSKKRKTLDSIESCILKPKRVNSDLLNPSQPSKSASPPLVTFQSENLFDTQVTSPTESWLSLSPCNFMPSPPPPMSTYRCNSAQLFNQGLSPNFYSSLSPSISMNELAPSPSYFNFPSEQDQDEELMNQIKFSPSINNESSCCTSEEEEDEFEEENQDELKEENIEIDSKKDEEELDENLNASQSIESINYVEACVFYVLSQLSHGDKPSNFLINNFEPILKCLLNYLKHAKIRNPRALRILNRLTKNQYCFISFVLNQLPYKLKTTFYNFKPILNKKSKLVRSKSLGSNLKLENDLKKESDIEKEMNIYLNSNKAFFDASSYFPSFESIEFTLINNLKSQCISSSDSGYLSLIQLMKQKNKEKLSTTLVAPFILRNSKALYYIMVQLNGLDLILDSIFSQEKNDDLRFKSILCIHKILSFINYKRDLKQIKDFFDQTKHQVNQIVTDSTEFSELVIFKFDTDKELKAKRNLLTSKSEYFNALLNGHFSQVNEIELRECSFEVFSILLDLLKCREDSSGIDGRDYKISFDMCFDLVVACDRFILNDLKNFFISILINKFMSLSTFLSCFKLSWLLSSTFLSNASIDYLLSEFRHFCIEGFNDAHLKDENINFSYFLNIFEYLLDNFKSDAMLTEHFKKTLKSALIEIIKNNNWKL